MIRMKIFSLLAIFLLILIKLIFLPPVAFAAYDPTEDFAKNMPWAFGVTCGVPNTKANACCSTSVDLKVTDDDLNSLVQDLRDGKQLTPEESDLFITLILVDTDFNDVRPLTDLFNKISNGQKLSQEEIKQLQAILQKRAIDINNLSGGDLLKLQVRRQYVEDRCIIDAKIVHGFCIRGISEFFAGILGDNPSFESIRQSLNSASSDKCVYGEDVGTGTSCRCVFDAGVSVLCNDYLIKSKEYNSCVDCYARNNGIWTGLGCINLTAAGFIQGTLLGWGVGLAGLFAFLCIIYSAFLLQTSAGNPERVKKAREYLTNCIIGLALIIFSIFILRLIGITILQIPGFS